MQALSVCMISILLAASGARGWRGLVPLHSNCEDAKRVLGISDCRSTTVDLEDVTVAVAFSDGTCELGWRVPAGTITSLDVHPKNRRIFADLRVDESRYKKVFDSHLPSIVYYENKDEGTSIAVLEDGSVANFFYGPAAEDDALKCSATNVTTALAERGSIKFDEYGTISQKEEEKRLDRFVKELKEWPKVSGFIVTYGQNQPDEGRKWSSRVKQYIVREGIESSRIFTVDGGFRKEPTIELFVVMQARAVPVSRFQ